MHPQISQKNYISLVQLYPTHDRSDQRYELLTNYYSKQSTYSMLNEPFNTVLPYVLVESGTSEEQGYTNITYGGVMLQCFQTVLSSEYCIAHCLPAMLSPST